METIFLIYISVLLYHVSQISDFKVDWSECIFAIYTIGTFTILSDHNVSDYNVSDYNVSEAKLEMAPHSKYLCFTALWKQQLSAKPSDANLHHNSS